MKTINFLNTMSLKSLAILGYLFWFILTASLFKITDLLINYTPNVDLIQSIKFGLITGLLLNSAFIFIVYNDRKSKSFWNYSTFVEDLIKKSKNRSELKSIFKKEFQELNNKSYTEDQNLEVHRIYSIINTKYNTLYE
jgi:hypothetical protein